MFVVSQVPVTQDVPELGHDDQVGQVLWLQERNLLLRREVRINAEHIGNAPGWCMDRLLKTSSKLLHIVNARSGGKAIMIKLDKCHKRWEEAAFSALRADCIWAKCKRK